MSKPDNRMPKGFSIILNKIQNLIQRETSAESGQPYEFCPRCEANLTLQKGYSNDLPFWICLGCGEMLINPEVDTENNIVWICDSCGRMMNIQPGFREDCGEWACTECGFANKIDSEELYVSEEEFQAELKNPYRGLKDEEVLRLAAYQDERPLNEKGNVFLVRNRETGRLYVRKILEAYDPEIFAFLKGHPMAHMPKILETYESSISLIVIEEYIEGRTLAKILDEGTIEEEKAVSIARSICIILDELHSLPKPVIHRDIKPANIMITPTGDVFLLDMNAAKWYDPEQTDDTRYMGTRNYAAPEQAGYGLSASSDKTDIYALGMLLNRMVTGRFPKEEKAPGKLWHIIERCISLEAEKRYTDRELMEALDQLKGDESDGTDPD